MSVLQEFDLSKAITFTKASKLLPEGALGLLAEKLLKSHGDFCVSSSPNEGNQ